MLSDQRSPRPLTPGPQRSSASLFYITVYTQGPYLLTDVSVVLLLAFYTNTIYIYIFFFWGETLSAAHSPEIHTAYVWGLPDKMIKLFC